MERTTMVYEDRSFLKLGILSLVGCVFYYAHLFLGFMANDVLFKLLAITFLLLTVPLPIIALNNKAIFPKLRSAWKKLLMVTSLLLLMHHFLMTFIFLLFLKSDMMH